MSLKLWEDRMAERVERSPKPICAAIRDSLAEWQAEYARDPENTNRPGFCRFCEAALPEPWVLRSESGILDFPITACEPCVAKRRDEIEEEKRQAELQRISRICGPDFAEPWDDNRGNSDLRRVALSSISISNRIGLLIHGTTGKCKTRVAWEIIKDIESKPLPFEGFSWLFFDSFELALKGVPNEAYTVPLLVIDDLGNEPSGGKWETNLLYLLKKRFDARRVTVITTQYSWEKLKEKFFSGTHAEAIRRRLSERCKPISADKPS